MDSFRTVSSQGAHIIHGPEELVTSDIGNLGTILFPVLTYFMADNNSSTYL